MTLGTLDVTDRTAWVWEQGHAVTHAYCGLPDTTGERAGPPAVQVAPKPVHKHISSAARPLISRVPGIQRSDEVCSPITAPSPHAVLVHLHWSGLAAQPAEHCPSAGSCRRETTDEQLVRDWMPPEGARASSAVEATRVVPQPPQRIGPRTDRSASQCNAAALYSRSSWCRGWRHCQLACCRLRSANVLHVWEDDFNMT